jgi:hypothetical protein
MAAKRTALDALVNALLIACLCSGADGAAPANSLRDGAPLGLDSPRPAHGGDVRLAGPLWLELVVGKSWLAVYVTDRVGASVDTSGAKGRATAHTDGKGTHIDLRPAGGNRLAGNGRLKLKRSTVVFVTVDLRGKKPYRAVFRPLERAATGIEAFPLRSTPLAKPMPCCWSFCLGTGRVPHRERWRTPARRRVARLDDGS